MKRKTALITGASGGLGLEFAKLCAEKHYDLILVARNEAKLNALQNELEEQYQIEVSVYAADLSRKDAAPGRNLNFFTHSYLLKTHLWQSDE